MMRSSRMWIQRLLLACLVCWGGASPAQETETQALIAKARRFLDHLIRSEITEARGAFDETMLRALSPEKLGKLWPAVLSQAGPFVAVEGVRTETQASYRMVFLTCRFKNTSLDVKVVFDSEAMITGLFFVPSREDSGKRPPPYVQMSSFREEEIEFGEDNWRLPGTLSIPVGKGPFPAVVLVHGSGPNDRDESIGPNKPFRDLAWGLASREIAVFRYEKRTRQYRRAFLDPEFKFTVWDETIVDALAALKILRQRSEIDAQGLFVLGHSLGGMLIPRIGMRDQDIKGFIILAGATEPLEEAMLRQMNYISSLDDVVTAEEKKQLARYRSVAEEIKQLKPGDAETGSKVLMGAFAAYWLDLRGYDPPTAAASLKKPIFVLQGGRDYQVTPADYECWRSVLKDRPEVRFKLYSDLNHLFMPGTTRSTPQEYLIPGHVSSTVIEDIAAWIISLFTEKSFAP